MKSVAFDKASSAGCIARFSGEKTDTKLRQIGTCDGGEVSDILVFRNSFIFIHNP